MVGTPPIPFRFVLDSGYSGSLGFVGRYAEILGLDASQFKQDGLTMTANGKTPVTKIRISEFHLGSFVLKDVDATISERKDSYVLPPFIGAPILAKLNFRVTEGYCELTLPSSSKTQRPTANRAGHPAASTAPPFNASLT